MCVCRILVFCTCQKLPLSISRSISMGLWVNRKAYHSDRKLPSRKLTWKPKKGPIKTTVLLKGGYMGFHVSLGECMHLADTVGLQSQHQHPHLCQGSSGEEASQQHADASEWELHIQSVLANCTWRVRRTSQVAL